MIKKKCNQNDQPDILQKMFADVYFAFSSGCSKEIWLWEEKISSEVHYTDNRDITLSWLYLNAWWRSCALYQQKQDKYLGILELDKTKHAAMNTERLEYLREMRLS